MCLHIELALLDVLLQMPISLILYSGQLQHGLSNCIKSTFQSRGIQCYMGCLHYNRSHWSGRSLRTWWSLSTGGSRELPISIRGSSTIQGFSTIRGPPPSGGPSPSGDHSPSGGPSPSGDHSPSGYPPLIGGLLFLSGYLPLSGGLPF